MSEPSEVATLNFKGNAVATSFFMQVFVGYIIGPEDVADFAEASIVEGLYLANACLT